MNNHEKWLVGQLTAMITAKDEFLIFEGDVVMFRNCFFDNAELSSILDWANKEGFAVKLTPKEKSNERTNAGRS